MSSATSVIPASHADLLVQPAPSHLATIGPEGAPHSTPVWFGWDGEFLRFSQTTDRQKYRNLQREPRVSNALVDVCDSSVSGESGVLERIEPDPDKIFINSMAKKLLGEDVNP
jgi:PPOX class probable F420-dependent enzyme